MILANRVNAFVLAGGEGRRLQALTGTTPKPLYQLGGVPIVERTLIALRQAGLRECVLLTKFKHEAFESYCGEAEARLGIRVSCMPFNGSKLAHLDAALWHHDPATHSLIVDGDSIFDSQIVSQLLTQTELRSAVIATQNKAFADPGVISSEEVVRVQVDADNRRVIQMGRGITPYSCFDTGIQLWSSATALRLRTYLRGAAPLAKQSEFLQMEANQHSISSFDIGGAYWIGIDNPAQYAVAAERL
jgi:choline kinase